jgi:hypothetical protein
MTARRVGIWICVLFLTAAAAICLAIAYLDDRS